MAKNLCAILIGADELTAIVLKPARKSFRLVGHGTHALSPEEQEQPGPALKAMMKSVKGAATHCRLVLPKEQATLHHVTLPSTTPSELKSMARFEAERHIPFNAERHSIGYQVLRQIEDGQSEALLAAVDGPYVERAVDAVRAAGLRSEGINVSSACLMNALLFAMPQVARNKTVALVAIGLRSLDLVYSVGGRILFSRSVPLGLQGLVAETVAPGLGASVNLDRERIGAAAKMMDMMELDKKKGPLGGASGDAARAWALKVIQELRRSYDYARREMQCPPIEAIVLAGEGAAIRNLPQYLYVNLNIEVSVLNPVAALPKAKTQGLPFGGLELTVPFGAAIAPALADGYRIDVTPDAYYRRLDRRRLIRNASVTSMFAAAALVLGWFAYVEFQGLRERLTADYNEAISQMGAQVRELREQDRKVAILEPFYTNPTSAMAVLDLICAYEKMPGRVTLKEFSFTKGQLVTLDGHAKDLPDLTNFTDYLNSSGLFVKIKILEQKPKRELRNRPELWVFRVQCEIPEYNPKPKKRKVPEKTPRPVSPAGTLGRSLETNV